MHEFGDILFVCFHIISQIYLYHSFLVSLDTCCGPPVVTHCSGYQGGHNGPAEEAHSSVGKAYLRGQRKSLWKVSCSSFAQDFMWKAGRFCEY